MKADKCFLLTNGGGRGIVRRRRAVVFTLLVKQTPNLSHGPL